MLFSTPCVQQMVTGTFVTRAFYHGTFVQRVFHYVDLFVTLYFDEYNGTTKFSLFHPGQIFQSIPMFKLGLEIEIRSLISKFEVIG